MNVSSSSLSADRSHIVLGLTKPSRWRSYVPSGHAELPVTQDNTPDDENPHVTSCFECGNELLVFTKTGKFLDYQRT